MSVISLTDITAAYGKKGVLEHFNLDITQGEFVMLIGTSGCGKTTALKLMNGLLKPNAGRVMVNGKIWRIPISPNFAENWGMWCRRPGSFPI